MKNILLINQSSELYGSDKVFINIVSEIKKAEGLNPIAIVPSDGPLLEILRELRVETHIVDVGKVSRASFSIFGLLKLAKEIFRSKKSIDLVLNGRQVDLVHSNALSVMAGAYWCWRRKVKHVWHVHEILLNPKFLGKAYSVLLNLFSDKIIFVSTAAMKWLCDENPKLKKKSHLIFNGLPGVCFSKDNSFRDDYSIREDEILITLAGRINKWKGHGLLVDAVKIVIDRNPDLKFKVAIVGDTVVGQEYLKSLLIDKVKDLGISDNFVFVDFTKEINKIWTETDIAVVPSTEPEPFGMVAIEAMAFGTPVVGAGHGGLTDIIEDGVTGLLFIPGDKISLANCLEKLCLNPEIRNKMAIEGISRQKRLFSLESQVGAIISYVYKSEVNLK